jgi:hypothetical protein
MRLPHTIFDGNEPISEQESQTLAIKQAIDDEVNEHINSQWSKIKRLGAAGLLLVVVGVGIFSTGNNIGIGISVLGLLVGGGGIAYVRSQEPDISVTGIQKGYWTGYMIPDRDGTVVFDATDSIERKEFSVELLDDPDVVESVEENLAEMSEFPVVMTDQSDVETDFVQSVADVQNAINTAERHELTAPVLTEKESAVSTLDKLAPMAEEDPIDAGGVSVPLEKATDQVTTFSDFESMADEDHGESTLLNVSDHSRDLANELSGLQETATSLLNDHIKTAGDMFGMISYNFYCPDCMEDDIESQLAIVGGDGEWHCDACRSNFALDGGIPRHRIRDEVVLDVWDQLWTEKDDQRREVYESIEDQKAELKEREFEQRREEIRNVENRIKDIRSRIRDLQTEAKAKEGIVEEIGDLMVKYERLSNQRKEKFRQDISDSFERIDQKTQETLEETEGIVENRIQEAENEAEQRAEMMREEERQRHKEQMAQQRQIAKAQMEQQAEIAEGQVAKEAEIAGRQVAEQQEMTKGVMGAIATTHANKPDKRGK